MLTTLKCIVVQVNLKHCMYAVLESCAHICHKHKVIALLPQGANGMCKITAALQRALVRECRRRNVPVIFDEVRLLSEVAGCCLTIQISRRLFISSLIWSMLDVCLCSPHCN